MKVVVLLSGGLDSAALLARSLKHGDHPHCLAVDYGQRHRRELAGAATVVPARNLLFATLGVAHALKVGARSVLLGAHKGDAAVYPDCREEFFRALDAAASVAYGVRVWAPFCTHDDKRVVAIYAQIAGVPIDLTWSCYAGGETPCGECGACCERALALAGQTASTVQSASGGSR